MIIDNAVGDFEVVTHLGLPLKIERVAIIRSPGGGWGDKRIITYFVPEEWRMNDGKAFARIVYDDPRYYDYHRVRKYGGEGVEEGKSQQQAAPGEQVQSQR